MGCDRALSPRGLMLSNVVWGTFSFVTWNAFNSSLYRIVQYPGREILIKYNLWNIASKDPFPYRHRNLGGVLAGGKNLTLCVIVYHWYAWWCHHYHMSPDEWWHVLLENGPITPLKMLKLSDTCPPILPRQCLYYHVKNDFIYHVNSEDQSYATTWPP